MPAVLKLGSEEIKGLIGQLSEQEKIDVYKSLRKSVLKSRYLDFADRKKNIPISLDDITEAVEAVRSGPCPSA